MMSAKGKFSMENMGGIFIQVQVTLFKILPIKPKITENTWLLSVLSINRVWLQLV